MANVDFDEKVVARVRVTREALAADGALMRRDVLDGYLERFRAKFGREALQALDGVALLEAMHGRKSRDGLMYWLEFKNDDDFASPDLGSISGGSALKFGVFVRASTGEWVTGSAQQQEVVTRDDAVEIARGQKREILAAVDVLDSLGPMGIDPSSVDFEALDARLQAAMPSLYHLAWSHKYLSLLFPDRVDFYHSESYQTFHQVRLLIEPRQGRYAAAEVFVVLARLLDVPMQHVGATLNHLHGGPYSYWRLGTHIGGASRWDAMRSGGFAAVGYAKLGDLSDIATGPVDADAWKERYREHHPHDHPPTESAERRQLLDFVREAAERDVVVAVDGKVVLGIGSITGPYEYHPERAAFPHARPVEWRDFDEWKLEENLRSTFRRIKSHANWLTVERRLFEPRGRASGRSTTTGDGVAILRPLDPTVARVERILRRKGQVILYGPPGTGKTFWGERAVFELSSRAWFQRPFDPKDASLRTQILDAGAVESCSFHPAYGYEDFIEGYRPVVRNGAMTFELRDGVFKRMCKRATDAPTKPFYLLIDEINRGDIPRIFGELLSLLELDKRGKPFSLPLSATAFQVPPNLFVVGTMNTADRSIALLDAALRRRFGFIELMPSAEPLGTGTVGGIPLGPWLVALNRRILEHVGRDARNLQVGHAYLLERGAPVTTPDRFAEVLQEDVIPLLQEYCYDDFPLLEKMLGKALVDVEQKRLRDSLFDPSRRQELLDALLAAFPDLSTAAAPPPAVDEDENDDAEAPE